MDDLSLKIKISNQILDNSIDLLLDGVESMKHHRDGPFYWSSSPKKSALLAVTIGVELLLKAKIVSLDWRQLFENPNKADKARILDGSLFSVRFENILNRIELISTITFSKQTQDDIEEIRKIRNKIVHYHYDAKGDEIIKLIATAIGIYIEFYREHIFKQFYEEIDRTRDIDRELKGEKDYVINRIETIKKHISEKPRPYTYYFSECNECLQDVFVIKDMQTVLCSYCLNEESIQEKAESHSEYKNKTTVCPKCHFNSMAALHDLDKEPEAWQCIICGHYINYPAKWGLGDKTSSVDSIRLEFRGKPFIPII